MGAGTAQLLVRVDSVALGPGEPGGRLFVDPVSSRVRSNPEQAAYLELADALACQVRQAADFLERDAAALRDVKGTTFLKLPRLAVRKVQLEAAGLVYVKVEMLPAPNPWAWSHCVSTLAAGRRALLVEHDRLRRFSSFYAELTKRYRLRTRS